MGGRQQSMPLLDWPQDREVQALIMARADLRRRIEALPRHSHQRVALQARLEEKTREQLTLELGRERRP